MILINNARKNIAKAKAIQRQNIQRLKKLNPDIDNKSGIYFLTRNEPQIYVGQARHLDERLASHLSGYEQHIDRSLKAHGLYSEDNPYGYKVNFLHYPESKLDAYKAIGTVEECREAVDKQKPKKIIIEPYCPTECPTCGHELSTSLGDGYYKHPIFLERCPECGQAIQW